MKESDPNTLLRKESQEQEAQSRSVYGHTRGDEHRSDAALRPSSSLDKLKNNHSFIIKESDPNALLGKQSREQEAQSRSVYGHTRGDEHRSDAALRPSSSIWADSRAFTLFEVLVALTVFAFAVGGLAIALESVSQACIDARDRALARLQLESRIAYNMVDPPLEGERVIKNNGIAIMESLTPLALQDANNQEVMGIYRLTITAQSKKGKDTAEIFLYRP